VFGFRRFDESVARWAVRGSTARETLEGMWSDLRAWSGGEFQHDDVTLVVLRVPKATVVNDGESRVTIART
jgi:serine phosphatase RsbU (regulator of sigma subunit)